jgi:2-oxoisovalerate dehydrogenase E1 component
MNNDTYFKGVQIRHFEETLLELFAQGRLQGTVHTCIGQEAVALAVTEPLKDGDWIFSNHRCHGHYLAWNDDVAGLLAEIMGLPSGICGGRGGSQHIYRDQFLSNGVQGGGVPIAVGCAMRMTFDKGSDGIAVAYIGDGTLGQGVIYEAMNLASKWGLPLLLVLEKNGYAQSTNTAQTISGDVGLRFKAFGLKYWEANIWDLAGLFTNARAAVDHVRQTRTPAAISVDCYRLKAHSKGDDNRDKEEIAAFLIKDPIHAFSQSSPAEYEAMRRKCDARVRDILSALDGTWSAASAPSAAHAAPAALGQHWHPVAQASAKPARVLERLRAGLRQLLETDPRVVVIGEDIEDPYGGAFKVTKGLSDDFPGRVRNTPISEAAIAGVGNGLALSGMRPVVEIMFGDFVTLAADQLINQASKFSYMYNDQVSVPVIVRTAMGGKRGYGATHSQCLEKHFFGTPGLSVVCVNSVFDPGELLVRVHDSIDGPCLFIENKLTYSSYVSGRAPDGRIWMDNGAPLPTLRLGGHGQADVTLVTYGGMLEECAEAAKIAFEEHEIVVEIVVPTRVYPLDTDPIFESVSGTLKVLTVEEGQGFSGFGSEVLAACAEKIPGCRSARVFAETHPIPCARELEKHALPNLAKVIDAIRSLIES